MKKKMVLTWLLWLFGIIVALALILFFLRLFSHREIDDVSPGISCEPGLLEKADVLWVIPEFEGKNASDDKEWCSMILALNKKLELHGVHHTYNEFGADRSEEYLQSGILEFEKCFGYKPGEFKAPQLELNEKNREMIKDSGLRVRGLWNQWTHKVYHCNDTGEFPNWMIDLF